MWAPRNEKRNLHGNEIIAHIYVTYHLRHNFPTEILWELWWSAQSGAADQREAKQENQLSHFAFLLIVDIFVNRDKIHLICKPIDVVAVDSLLRVIGSAPVRVLRAIWIEIGIRGEIVIILG